LLHNSRLSTIEGHYLIEFSIFELPKEKKRKKKKRKKKKVNVMRYNYFDMVLKKPNIIYLFISDMST